MDASAGQRLQTHGREHSTVVSAKKVLVMMWPNQLPDLNPIEILWRELKARIQKKDQGNLTDLRRVG